MGMMGKSQPRLLFLILLVFGFMQTGCSGSNGLSLFSAQSYCQSSVNGNGTCIDSNSSGQSIYLQISSGVAVKAVSLQNPTFNIGGGMVLPGQQLAVNGTCNTGGALANMITYTITDQSGNSYQYDIYGVQYVKTPSDAILGTATKVYQAPTMCPTAANLPAWAPSVPSSCMRVAFCENGKFHLEITPPYVSVTSPPASVPPTTFCTPAEAAIPLNAFFCSSLANIFWTTAYSPSINQPYTNQASVCSSTSCIASGGPATSQLGAIFNVQATLWTGTSMATLQRGVTSPPGAQFVVQF